MRIDDRPSARTHFSIDDRRDVSIDDDFVDGEAEGFCALQRQSAH
ncbi:hypothetical protein [Natrinema gelatinilyticum]|nr:hypothetical protein [Natrinema gelatinilyticum]